MALNVINQLSNAVVKFNIIIKICKYRELHKKHHFVPMVMKVQGALEYDMNHFIKGCALFSMINDLPLH
jgi:hypothetical protein